MNEIQETPKKKLTLNKLIKPLLIIFGVAAHLYYCLNQVSDGIEDLELFTLNYDDYYLHTGQELFRIADKLRLEAQAAIKGII